MKKKHNHIIDSTMMFLGWLAKIQVFIQKDQKVRAGIVRAKYNMNMMGSGTCDIDVKAGKMFLHKPLKAQRYRKDGKGKVAVVKVIKLEQEEREQIQKLFPDGGIKIVDSKKGITINHDMMDAINVANKLFGFSFDPKKQVGGVYMYPDNVKTPVFDKVMMKLQKVQDNVFKISMEAIIDGKVDKNHRMELGKFSTMPIKILS